MDKLDLAIKSGYRDINGLEVRFYNYGALITLEIKSAVFIEIEEFNEEFDFRAYKIVHMSEAQFEEYFKNTPDYFREIEDCIYLIQEYIDCYKLIKQSECFEYLLCNYLRTVLMDMVKEETEEVIKVFCKFIGIGYSNERAEVELISVEQFNHVGYDRENSKSYNLYNRHTWGACYLVDNLLYLKTSKENYVKIKLHSSVTGILPMLILSGYSKSVESVLGMSLCEVALHDV